MAQEIYKVKTFDQIVDSMRRYLIGKSSTLNNFNEGSRILTLLESVALIISRSENDFFQSLKLAIPVAIYDGFGFSKKIGVQSSGKLTFYRGTPADKDYVIPSGTTITLNGIQFTTTEDGLLSLGATQSNQPNAQCTIVGTQGNINAFAIDTLSGYGSFVNQPDGVESCKNLVPFTNGEDEESDDARVARFNTYIGGLARSTLSGIKSAVLSVSGISAVTIVENFPKIGYVTIYADNGSGTISTEQIDEILKIINGDPNDSVNYPGYRAAGIIFSVIAPTIQYINVTALVSIISTSSYDDATIKATVNNAIVQYLNTRQLGNDIILSELVTVAMNSHPDVYDFSVSIPTNNVIITSDKVARAGTISLSSTRVSA